MTTTLNAPVAPRNTQGLEAALQSSLLAEIARIGAYGGGETGVAALHLETGRQITLNNDQLFPPCSSIKLPLALRIFEMIDQGALSLDQLIEVAPVEMNPMGPGGLAELFQVPGMALSVRNHMEGMITRSCNTSTDVLFRVAGGTAAVSDWLRRTGIQDFACSLTMRQALCVMHDIPLPDNSVSMVEVLRNAPPEIIDARNSQNIRFQHEKRDLCRPTAMLDILRRIHQADGVSPDTSGILLDIMSRTVGTHDRIAARLPQGIGFASKTGSGAGSAVDVGYVTLPEGRGTLALAIFIKGSPFGMDARNRAIADVARLLADYFTITVAPSAQAAQTA